MSVVRCFGDLKRFGVEALTMESCGLGCRMLCDLTPEGVELMREVLGIPAADFPPGYNTGAASVHVPFGLVESLAVFGFLKSGYRAAIVVRAGDGDGGLWVYGVRAADLRDLEATRESLAEAAKGTAEVFRPRGDAAKGRQNVHQMSGRVL